MEKQANKGVRRLARELAGKRVEIDVIDRLLIELLAWRVRVAGEIGRIKVPLGRSIVCPKNEEKKLAWAFELARKMGVNPHSICAILTMAIGESCRIQIRQQDEIRTKKKRKSK